MIRFTPTLTRMTITNRSAVSFEHEPWLETDLRPGNLESQAQDNAARCFNHERRKIEFREPLKHPPRFKL